ncbi:hypothetical protein ACFSJQ_02030 [Vibrio olivae]
MGTQLCSVTEISDYRYHEQKIWKALIGGFITGRSALPPAMGLDHAVFNTLKNQMLDVGIFEVSEQQSAAPTNSAVIC